MSKENVPKCGMSDKRNDEYEATYTPGKFFKEIVKSDSPVIFDVGAHQGESLAYFNSIFNNPKIFSFEPHPENYDILKDVAGGLNADAFQLAVGSENGVVDFFVQDITHLGGLLPVNNNSKDSLGYAEKAQNKTIKVECKTLDSIIEWLGLSKIDVLKIDVQGFEVGVLRGARNALDRVDIVMVEVSIFDFYQNNSDGWFEVNDILNKAGFELWDIAKISKNPRNLRTDWVELVFKK
jgi:FkbM family methyltransferase